MPSEIAAKSLRSAGPLLAPHDVVPQDLSTTNRFLGLIAAASVLEMAAILAVCIGLLMVSRRMAHLIKTVEEMQLAPAATRVHGILDDVGAITSAARSLVSRLRRHESE